MRWRNAATPNRYTATLTSTKAGKVVIGIDPGLARTGIGVISANGKSYACLYQKVVRTDTSMGLAQRLAWINGKVLEVCKKTKPQVAAVERTFVNENPASSLALGQARGAALAALGSRGIQVIEIAPNTVKRNLTGDSFASKPQVANMVRSVLGIPSSTRLAADASDALAIAISHTARRPALLRRGRRRRRR